jgi:hypothetical protein
MAQSRRTVISIGLPYPGGDLGMVGRGLALATVIVVVGVSIAGCLDPPRRDGAPSPTVSMVAGSWVGTSCTVEITAVASSTLEVANLTYQVVAKNGTIYYSGAAGTSTEVNGVTVTITYNDAQEEGKVGPDDNIAVSVGAADQLSQIQGTQFKIFEGVNVVGTAALP